MDDTLRQINELTLADGKITGVSTGLDVVDNKLSGHQNSQLILLAARPAMGKTALGLTMAWNAARNGKSVAFFYLEMSIYQLNQRRISIVSLVGLESIRNGPRRDDDWTLLIEATKKIVETDLYVDETPGIRLSEMKSKLKRLKA